MKAAFTGREKLRNPVLAKSSTDYVPNDIALDSTRLCFVTDPTAAARRHFCKSLAQTQLLAQIGAYVPAEEAALTVADHIFYQVPEISHLTMAKAVSGPN